MIDTDFPSPATNACPYADYARFRAAGPIVRLPQRSEYAEFAVSRYEDIFEIVRRPEVFSSHQKVIDQDGWFRAPTIGDCASDYPWGLTDSDPPLHRVQRKLARDLVAPARLREYEPIVTRLADDLIDGFVERRAVEFMSEFASPLPAHVILTLFDLPLELTDRALSWANYEGVGMRFATEEGLAAGRESVQDLRAFMRDLNAERRARPADDEYSRLHLRHREAGIDPALTMADATTIFVGSIGTTGQLIGNTMLLLLQHPEQMAEVRQDRTLIANAVDESLRLEAPVRWAARLTIVDTEVHGVEIPAGSHVYLVWASANRDEQVFDEPERFDVGRKDAAHLAFGSGEHHCLGAPLARLEARIAFERLFDRTREIRLAAGRDDVTMPPSAIFHGPRQLFLEFD